MPGSPRRVHQVVDTRRDHAEVLGHQGERAQPRPGGVDDRPARSRIPGALAGRQGVAGDPPPGLERAEVVDPEAVVEGGAAAQALDPPALAVARHRIPVVGRVAPQLAVGRERVRRHAGHEVGPEEVRVGRHVGGVGGHVEGDVAHDADAAVGRVGAQGAPLAVEAHLVGEGVRPGRVDPVVDPVPVELAEACDLDARDRPRGDEPGSRARRRTPTGWRRASRARRAR